jgi:hypothetical protein
MLRCCVLLTCLINQLDLRNMKRLCPQAHTAKFGGCVITNMAAPNTATHIRLRAASFSDVLVAAIPLSIGIQCISFNGKTSSNLPTTRRLHQEQAYQVDSSWKYDLLKSKSDV